MIQKKARTRKCHLGQGPIPSLMGWGDLGTQEGMNEHRKCYYLRVVKKPHILQGGWPDASVCPVYPTLCLLSQLTAPSVTLKHVLAWTVNVTITLVISITMPHALHQHNNFSPKVIVATR